MAEEGGGEEDEEGGADLSGTEQDCREGAEKSMCWRNARGGLNLSL